MSQDQLESLVGKQYPIEYWAENNRNGHHYALNLLFKKQNAEQYFILDVKIAAYGSLLLEGDYQKDRQALSDGGHRQDAIWFPNIGSRAQRFLLGFGPGGASEQIRFSTSDKALDIQVTLSHNLPQTVEIERSIDEIAEQINFYYNSR